LGGYIHVTSTAPVFALELFGSTSFTFLANVSGQGENAGQPGILPVGGASLPYLISLSTYSVQKNSTVTLDVTGNGFTRDSVVLIDSVPLPTTFLSSTSLHVTYAASTSGTRLIAVWKPGGAISNSTTFTVIGQPTITSMRPIAASIGQTNVPFTIKGSDLDLITGVSFLVNGNPDPGIIVSSFLVDPSGTQATFVVTITGTAVPSAHFINLNSIGF